MNGRPAWAPGPEKDRAGHCPAKERRMRTVVSVIISAAIALMVSGVPAYAGAEDDAIEAAVKGSHVFRENLKEDDIRIQSRDGVVILSGTVSDESHKDLARDTVSSIPGVKGVEAKQ